MHQAYRSNVVQQQAYRSDVSNIPIIQYRSDVSTAPNL